LVVLGVSGSIAAYKALEVASALVQRGIQVRVVMTESAQRFVTPLSFESITHHPVLHDLWSEQPDMNISHVRLAQAASALAIVPATANTIAELAHGFARDALTATALATRAPLILAPAMNSLMWTHAATQSNMDTLRRRGAVIVEPVTGYLAEGAIGPGRLADVPDIVEVIQSRLSVQRNLDGEYIVVTAGPTREAIDPVRYLSNRSSGKMGYAIAEAAAARGARVTLISGPVKLAPSAGISLRRVVTADEMFQEVESAVSIGCTLIMAAAVADYKPVLIMDHKLKRKNPGMTLELAATVDILASIRRPVGMRLVAFAAETEDLLANAAAKLTSKRVDMLVANDVTEEGAGFDSDTNHVWLFRPGVAPREVPLTSKRHVADAILDAMYPASGVQ
jgi:phosphopantothenoylcysteine decarboxylase/phosphopantothenate--cysteine ligase